MRPASRNCSRASLPGIVRHAVPPHRVQGLVEQGRLQLALFDERPLLALSSPDYPGERLVACRNPQLAKRRAHRHNALLAAMEVALATIKTRVDTAKLADKDTIGLRVGKVISTYKVAKHFALDIGEHAFSVRSLKTIDLNVRPIHHRLADRVRAHLFLRVLAHYVGWRKRVELQLSDSSPAWRARSRSVAGCRT